LGAKGLSLLFPRDRGGIGGYVFAHAKVVPQNRKFEQIGLLVYMIKDVIICMLWT
jgi:hypothetical protein